MEARSNDKRFPAVVLKEAHARVLEAALRYRNAERYASVRNFLDSTEDLPHLSPAEREDTFDDLIRDGAIKLIVELAAQSGSVMIDYDIAEDHWVLGLMGLNNSSVSPKRLNRRSNDER